MVGRPLFCDELTLGCKRLDFARLCMEVDASLSFGHKFELEFLNSIREVHVNYEWKLKRYEKCQVFGHSCQLLIGKQVNSDTSLSHQVKDNASPAIDTDKMSSEALDYSVETDTNSSIEKNTNSSADTEDSSDETDTDELAYNSLVEALLKSSDLRDVNPITSSLSIEDHVRTSLLELPLCITSKQMSLPSSSETSSSSRVPTTNLTEMTPSHAPFSASAQSIGCDDTRFTLVTLRKKEEGYSPDENLGNSYTYSSCGTIYLQIMLLVTKSIIITF